MADISIIRAGSITASENLTRLFTELTGTETVPDVLRINSLISAGTLAVYLAVSGEKPVGMISVVPCRTAMGDKLWIEDFCILSECRGLGLGRKLITYAMTDSTTLFGPGEFRLTSRPSRVAARALYSSLGFREVETGVFKR